VIRARILLGAADGLSTTALAAATGVHADTVRARRKRFGQVALADAPGRVVPGFMVPRHDYGSSRQRRRSPPATQPAWTYRLLTDAVGDLGNSASQVGRILAQADPEFFTRTAQVCSVYRHHRPRRREFEYGRHGPVSIIAALGVHA
jgi:hypothetical protein